MTRSALLDELRTLVRLSIPVALTQFGLMLTTVVDTMMVGHLGPVPLGALALGNTWHWAFMVVGLGILMGIDPLIAQAHGRRDEPGARLAMQRGMVLAWAMSVPGCLLLVATDPVLRAMGQESELVAMAQTYNLWKLPSVPAMFIFTVQRQYLQGRAIMAPATWAMAIANAFNVLANWVLIWGEFGFPALGLRGAAIATSLTSLLLPVLLGAMMHGLQLEPKGRGFDRRALSLAGLSQVLKLGGPVGIHMGLEHWAFAGSAFLAGLIGVNAVGGHHVTLNLAALAFMLPLGISMGAATRVGNLIGAEDALGMRRAVRAALSLAVVTMGTCAITFLAFRNGMARLYTDDRALISLVASVLPVVAAFQIADGLQVVSAGILRSMGRPRPGAVVNLVAYYVIGFPLAYLLTFRLGYGVRGIWIALAVGVSCAAAMLITLSVRTARRDIRELAHHVHEAG